MCLRLAVWKSHGRARAEMKRYHEAISAVPAEASSGPAA